MEGRNEAAALRCLMRIYFEGRVAVGGGSSCAEWIQWAVAFAAGVSLLPLMTDDLLCFLDEFIKPPTEPKFCSESKVFSTTTRSWDLSQIQKSPPRL